MRRGTPAGVPRRGGRAAFVAVATAFREVTLASTTSLEITRWSVLEAYRLIRVPYRFVSVNWSRLLVFYKSNIPAALIDRDGKTNNATTGVAMELYRAQSTECAGEIIAPTVLEWDVAMST